MSREWTCAVPESAAGERLDVFVAAAAGEARSAVAKWCKAGAVTVNAVVRKANYRLRAGDAVCAVIPAAESDVLTAEDIPLEILYEDEDMLVINKPRGMVVHPAYGHRTGTLVHALLGHTGGVLADTGDEMRPGIVHRLDRDTSGVMMAVKTARGRDALTEQIRDHTARREYLAIVHGDPAADAATIRLPLGRDAKDRMKRAVVAGGREAVTHLEVVTRYAGYALVRCRLETGRTHQIRVHLAHIGLPVAGDALYGRRKEKLPLQGQALHSARLTVARPSDGSIITCEAPLPADMTECLRRLEEMTAHG